MAISKRGYYPSSSLPVIVSRGLRVVAIPSREVELNSPAGRDRVELSCRYKAFGKRAATREYILHSCEEEAHHVIQEVTGEDTEGKKIDNP